MSIHGQFAGIGEYEGWLVPRVAVCGGAREVNQLRDVVVFMLPVRNICVAFQAWNSCVSMPSPRRCAHVQRVVVNAMWVVHL